MRHSSKPIVDLTTGQIDRVRSLRVYFGHQSVGQNLLEGLDEIASNNPAIRLNIVATEAPEEKDGPVIAHFEVGANTKPDSKLSSFKEHMQRTGNRVDVAFFKFCYVDVGKNTDADALFQSYRTVMSELRKQFPLVTFVHVTVPLTTIESGVRGFVKKLIGRDLGQEENAIRTKYNNLLRKEYLGHEPVFDLAAAESVGPGGAKLTGTKSGMEYEMLCPEYTSDGGHLNRLGREHCAAVLLKTLSIAAESRSVVKK